MGAKCTAETTNKQARCGRIAIYMLYKNACGYHEVNPTKIEISLTAYKFFKLLLFFLIRYLTLGSGSHLQTLYITNVSIEEKPRHLSIYYCIQEVVTSSHLCLST